MARIPVLAALMLVAAPVSLHARPQVREEPVIAVPGGVVQLLEAFDLRSDLPRSRLLLTAIRVLWEDPPGLDPERDQRRAAGFAYLRRIDRPEALRAAGAEDIVPSFLGPAQWTALLGDMAPGAASILTGILRNRRPALFYYGLASLDEPTRAYLLDHPDLLRRVSEDGRVGIFATFARSLQVRDGGVQVPGGPAALPLWEDLAEERAANADLFMQRVLSRDQGRLALLYDGIAHLQRPMQRFALGLDAAPAARKAQFRALYDAAGKALKNWRPQARPFQREPFDLVHLLLCASAGPHGSLAGPPWPRFWRAVFEPLDASVTPPTAVELEEKPFNVAGLIELLTVDDTADRTRRCETWLFARRVFPEPSPGDVPELLLALRGFAAYPSLLLTLERMGIQSPATYGAAVRAAGRFTGANRSLWQFQAALAILERARTARSIDPSTADGLVRRLCALTPAGGDSYGFALAKWIEHDLLESAGDPLVPQDVPSGGRPLETRLLAAMAGSVPSAANRRLLALPPLEWEGLRYRVDPGRSTLARFLRVRERQSGPSLDAVLAFARLAEQVPGARSGAEVRQVVARLDDVVQALRESSGPPRWKRSPEDERQPEALVRRARAMLTASQDPPPGRALAEVALLLRQAVDAFLASVLGSLAYTPHLGDADSPALLAGDPAHLHDFRLSASRMDVRRRGAWEVPGEFRDDETGWHVSGSLLCLDFALGHLSLMRVPRDTLPQGHAVPEMDRQALTDSAVALAAFDLTDDTRSQLLQALERGRLRVTAIDSSTGGLERLAAEAGLDEWRREALGWTLAHERARILDTFSLGELLLAGGLDPSAIDRIDSWGTCGYPVGNSLAARFPARLSWTTLAGRRAGRSRMPALVPDLVIGLAEASARINLPAPLTAGLVLVASQDLVETLHPAHEDDWLAIVAAARSVAGGRMDDYVAALTVAGPLVPEWSEK